MLKRFVPSFLLLVIFLAPSANTPLRAQLSQVFEADSTQEWWVHLKGGHLYYGYIRALGTDSIRVIEGERGEKHLAVTDVLRVTPKGRNIFPLTPPKKRAYGRYLQPVAVNALPHDNEVYIKLRHFITPEVEVNFLNRHSVAGFFSMELEEVYKPLFFGFRYRYALPINERLHWAGCAMYISNPTNTLALFQKNQVVLSSILTFDAGFADISIAPIHYQYKEPKRLVTPRQGSGVGLGGMLQFPVFEFISINADWLFIPNSLPETTFGSPYHGHNLLFGLKFHSRSFHLQISYVERAAIRLEEYLPVDGFPVKVALSLRIGKKKSTQPE